MAKYDYQLASGFNQAGSLVNIETTIGQAPRGTLVSLGARSRTSISGVRNTDGEQIAVWNWDVLTASNLGTIITTYLTNWNTDTAEVTLRTRLRDGTYANFNAIMYLPLDGEDYEHRFNKDHVNDLRIRFRIVAAL
jgi:hypothetical protein